MEERWSRTVSSSLFQQKIKSIGGMSKKPHQITTSALVFNGIKVVGVANGALLMDPKNFALRKKIFDELQVLLSFNNI
jgi:hypothetical protein